jgi:hypothetical protein
MKCQVCRQESKTGNTYRFLSTIRGETTRKKTGFKEYTYTTPYLLVGEKRGFVCRTCFLKSLLFSDVGLILIVVPLLSLIMLFDTFLESLIIGLFLAGLVLFVDIVLSGGHYFFAKYGDRALIRVWRKDPEYKDYELLDRAKAAKIGLIKGKF